MQPPEPWHARKQGLFWEPRGGEEQQCPAGCPSAAAPAQASSSCLPWMPKSSSSGCQHLGKAQAVPNAVGQMPGCRPACHGGPQPCPGQGVSAAPLLPWSVQGCWDAVSIDPMKGVCQPSAPTPLPRPSSEGLRGVKTGLSRDGGWQPQLGASRHGEKPSWEPTSCMGPKLIFAVAGGTMAQPGQLRCPSLLYRSRIRSRCGAGHTTPHPASPRHQDSHGQTRMWHCPATRHRTAAGSEVVPEHDTGHSAGL